MELLVTSGEEVGMQVAVCTSTGDVLAHVCGGVTRLGDRVRVTERTAFRIFSATKGITATALHVQAAKGRIGYDDLIVEHWPEFGQGGKHRATVRDALTHSVGIPQMPDGVSVEAMCDWDRMIEAVARLEPLWEPGTRSGYHAYTFGWIIGELVRRTDPARRPFCDFVDQEVGRPLGMDRFWLGSVPVDAEIAALVDARGSVDRSGLRGRAIPAHLDTSEAVFGRPDVQRSCHPAAGAVSDALSVARHYAALSRGGRASLFTNDHVSELSAIVTGEEDQVLGRRIRKALGYWVAGPAQDATAPMGTESTSFGHPGAGGSIGWADRSRAIGVGIVKNLMSPVGPDAKATLRLGRIIRAEVPPSVSDGGEPQAS